MNAMRFFSYDRPKFTVVTVMKRINTRLFVTGSHANDLRNPQPGTVVDTVITGGRSVSSAFVQICFNGIE